jgi:hypothetical protein
LEKIFLGRIFSGGHSNQQEIKPSPFILIMRIRWRALSLAGTEDLLKKKCYPNLVNFRRVVG